MPINVTYVPPSTVNVQILAAPVVSANTQPNSATLINASNNASVPISLQVAPNRGPQGNPGASGYQFTQASALAIWNIAHNLGRQYVTATVYDSAGSQVIGDVKLIDSNNLTITFSSAFAGTAYVI